MIKKLSVLGQTLTNLKKIKIKRLRDKENGFFTKELRGNIRIAHPNFYSY